MPKRRRPNRGQNLRRDTLIFEMADSGARYAVIAQALERAGFTRISERRIGVIVNSMLDDLGDARREMGERMFDHKLSQLNGTIRSNWAVLNAKCARCHGKGDLGQDPDGAPGTMIVCDKCNGTSFQYPPRDRASASKEVRLAIDQQCRMLGLYAPEKFALTDPEGNEMEFWMGETKSLDEADLDKQLRTYMEGVEAGRKEMDFAKEAQRDSHAEPSDETEELATG